MSSTAIIDVTEAPSQKAVLLFWAPWHEASVGPMSLVMQALMTASSSESIVFGRVQAEECPTLTEKYQVTMVPTFVLLDDSGSVFQRIEGGTDVSVVTQAVKRLAETSSPSSGYLPVLSEEEKLTQRMEGLIRTSDVMLFMKGAPDNPRCGFSRQAVEMLQSEKIPFGSFDILSDEAVRQGLKKYSNWPTYPQLYVKGELIGGLDIMKELKEEGSLKEQLGEMESQEVAPVSLDERLSSLIKRSPIMLFMKGLPSAPRCGFSRQIVEILDEEGVEYDAFDILQDEDVRQGLKVLSNWPTYPQLYVNGELIGGLDIVKEMKEDGSLKDALTH